MSRAILALKCYGCNSELNDLELKLYYDFDGMCEQCYASSMEAAFNDDFINLSDDIGEDE